METPAPSRSAIALTQFLLLGCAICEIAICNYQMVKYRYNPYYGWSGAYYVSECAYSPQGGSTTPCNYLYSLGAVAIFFSFIISLIQCLSGRRGNLRSIISMDIVLALFLLGWWIAGGVYFTQQYWVSAGNGAPSGANANWVMDSYRKGVYAVAWAAVGLSTVSLLLSFSALGAAKEADEEQHHHQEQQMSQMYAAPPPPGYAPPPPAGYYPPPGGYAPPPPAGYYPPPGGYAPPPPAGYYPPQPNY